MYFGKYKPLRTRSLRDRFFSSLTDINPLNKSVFLARREDVDTTEILNEIGTTDRAIGDATAETMITTAGPIPNVMYELEETTINTSIQSEIPATAVSTLTTMITEEIHAESPSNEISNHATLLIILTICSIILLLVCFAVTCIWAKSRGRTSCSSGLECDPDCDGARQPLIRTGKFSESTSKTTSSARR